MVPKQVSLVERSSLSQRVPCRRLRCTAINRDPLKICENHSLCVYVTLTLLLMGVNLVLRQCMHVEASLSGTQTAACSVAGILLAEG